MKAWLLAGIILILSCAIGAYYVNDSVSGILEGFFTDLTGSALRKTAEQKCETDYQACMNDSKSTSNATCTAAYNTCNEAAQRLATNVSTVPNAPASTTTLSSAPAALAYAVSNNMAGAGAAQDAIDWKNDTNPYFTAANPDSKYLIDLKEKIDHGYNPSAADLDAAQGYGFFASSSEDVNSIKGKLAEYIKSKQVIRPHEIPRERLPVITARTATGMPDDADSSNSIRSQIRNDINAAVKEEMDEIENEYEIVYE